jgi:transposase
VSASERNPQARLLWWHEVLQLNSARLVFVDESGSHLAMTPAYARAPRGHRAEAALPKNRGKNTTIIGALSRAGWQVAMTLEGAADTAAFEVFVECYLRPTLEPGQIVVLDNLSIHKSRRVRELIEEAGCRVLFLPTYSPDFNPIELAFAKIKTSLRAAAARDDHALRTATARAIDRITPADARAFYAHCGFPLRTN